MEHSQAFAAYLKEITAVAARGDAREESFYPALADMLAAVAARTGRKHIHVTTLPKPTDAGNPDFRLWDGDNHVVGYIEAKRPTEERLDLIENSEQLRRYRNTFPNLILTNFLEFRLYRDGERVETVLAARPLVLNQLAKTPPMEKPDELHALLDRFLGFSLPKAFTAETLAVELAKRTRFVRGITAQQLAWEVNEPGGLAGFYEAFRTYLIGTLTPEDFADLFAQTITYGLFAARTRTSGTFNRRTAVDGIPHTIGVLRDLFRFLSYNDLPKQLAWCVDDLAEVLAVADAPGILDRYYHEGKGSDPIVHFYETFLAEYDPGERERRGVYYTPEPVVGYIVRSLHGVLKSDFDKRDGLASDEVTLLDPAAGTMTFIAQATRLAVEEFKAKYGAGGRKDFIQRHILGNFHAFELMMAPYAVGHLKMSFLLEELGHRLGDDERMPFYLTNTLDNEELELSRLPGLSALAEESRLAGEVKRRTPILVILGNPPYSGHSSNMGEWIRSLIETYKQVDGNPLGEKNPKWLQDDYVKFLRFAQWKIEQAGRGVVGMITNHSYLDNPTFRGLRRSLMQTFDSIHVLNLHGNSLKKETSPGGGPDQNVFDIRQGVAIAFFIKHGHDEPHAATVCQADLYGARGAKYDWLDAHDLSSTKWSTLDPQAPLYLFAARNNGLETAYRRYPSMPDIFPINSVGIVTARDHLAIHWSAEEAWQAVLTFSRMDTELARKAYKLGRDARDWKVAMAQRDIKDSGPDRDKIVPILYRPFDVRYTYYTGHSRGFLCMPRPQVMRHMLAGENLALITPRQHKNEFGVHATRFVGAHKTVAAYDINYFFPLYVYPRADGTNLFSAHAPSVRGPNLNLSLVNALKEAYHKAPAPEDVLHYVHAVLHATAYRVKYAEFLRMDFPRVPFTSDAKLFRKLANLGARLTALHLLTSPELDPPTCRFEGEGDGLVQKGRKNGIRHEPSTRRVYINATQYFAPVTSAVWSFRVGGYQVCDKWLKDRKARSLTTADIRTYCRIVTALVATMKIQRRIDALYPDIEEDLLTIPGGVDGAPR